MNTSFNPRLVLSYDGLEKLSTCLLKSDHPKRVITKTSTFHFYLEIDILTLNLEEPIYISATSSEDLLLYKKCTKDTIHTDMEHYSRDTTDTLCVFNFLNPLSPHDEIKHHFTSLKTDLIFLQPMVLERKFP